MRRAFVKSSKSTGERDLFEGDIVKTKSFGVTRVGVIEFHKVWKKLAVSEKYRLENGRRVGIISSSPLYKNGNYHYMGSTRDNPHLLEVSK